MPLPELVECGEVLHALGQQPARKRNDCVACDTAASQDSSRQRSTDTTIAVGERMDRFELRVRDRRLHHHRNVIAIEVVDEVIHQPGHAPRCGGT